MEAGQCLLCHRTQAKFACSCVIPAIPICEVCIVTHLGTEGVHMPVPIQKPQSKASAPIQGNEVCDDCRGKAAINFCLCSNPIKKRCQDCDASHYQKAPYVSHSKHPIAAYQTVTRTTVETFRKKQQYISDLEMRIGEELTQFDVFISRARDEFEALIEKVTVMKEAFLQNLQAERVKLTTALGSIHQVIEAKRYEENLEVWTNLDDYIENGFKAPREYSLNMFSGKLELQGVLELLSKAGTFTLVENYLLDQISKDIPVIKGDSLRLYNSKTYQLTQRTLNQTTRIDRGTAYCYIQFDLLLCCGGETHNEVHEVNIGGAVMRAPSMHENRKFAGIFNWNGKYVYIFGGFNTTYLSSAEKYDIGRRVWVVVPSMQKAKYLCSVSQHSNGLYISGRDGSTKQTTIELFNPLGETYKLLYTDTGMPGILCCVKDEIYHIRTTEICIASLADNQAALNLQVKGTIPQVGNGAYSLCFPAHFSNEEVVGVLTAGGTPCGLFCFHPSRMQFSRIVNFTY